jgi:hypothetical protein
MPRPGQSFANTFESNPIGMFQTGNTVALRAAGLAGALVWGTFVDDALELRGDTGGALRIAPADLERARFGFAEGKGRRYRAEIWRVSTAEPVTLEPSPGTWPAYTRAMLAFAKGCLAAQRIDRIERGSTKLDALLPALLTAPLAVGTLLGAFVLTDDPWWGRTLVPALPTALLAVLLWTGLTRHWPRAIAEPDDLRIQLPPLA